MTRRQRLRRAGALLVGGFVLLALSQVTRFTNTIAIAVHGGSIEVSIGNSTGRGDLESTDFSAIDVETQYSMLSASGLADLSLRGSKIEPFELHQRELFVFGTQIPGAGDESKPSEFKPSFGDWTADRYDRPFRRVYAGPLSGDFQVTATFVGRGDKGIVLRGARELKILLRDGYIDNDFSLCTAQRCLQVAATEEPVLANLSRIANVGIEMLLAAVLLALAVELLNLCAGGHGPKAGEGKGSPPRTATSPDQGDPSPSPAFAESSTTSRSLIPILLFSAAAAHGLACWAFNRHVLDGIPHIPDSAVYYRQAIMAAKGMLVAPLPAVSPQQALVSNGGFIRDGNLIYQYPHFWPVLLAAFIALGLPTLANPLISVANLFLVYLVGKRMVGRRAALAGSVVYGFSPLSIVLAGDYMTHQATLLCLLFGGYALLRGTEGGTKLWFLLAGFASAYAICIRHLTGVAVVFPVSLFVLLQTRPSVLLRRGSLALLGALPMVAALLLDDQIVTGEYLATPHAKLHSITFQWSNLPLGANYADSTLGFLPQMVFSVPGVFLPLGFASLWVFWRFTRETVLLGMILPMLVLVHLFINTYGIHGYGPRFYFESIAALALLIGVGVTELERRLEGRIRRVIGGFVLLVLFGWNLFRLMTILPTYRNYNGLDSGVYEQLAALPPEKSLVVAPTNYWQAMDAGAVLFDPTFKKLVVVGERPDGSQAPLYGAFGSRELYKISGSRVVRLSP